VELHPEPPEACIDPPEQLVRPRDALRMVVVMAAEGEAVHDNAPTNGNLVYSEKALHVLCEIYISAEELSSIMPRPSAVWECFRDAFGASSLCRRMSNASKQYQREFFLRRNI
jgi:hypothetical protein